MSRKLYDHHKFPTNEIQMPEYIVIASNETVYNLSRFCCYGSFCFLFISIFLMIPKMILQMNIFMCYGIILITSLLHCYIGSDAIKMARFIFLILMYQYLISSIVMKFTAEIDSDTIYLFSSILLYVYCYDNTRCAIFKENNNKRNIESLGLLFFSLKNTTLIKINCLKRLNYLSDSILELKGLIQSIFNRYFWKFLRPEHSGVSHSARRLSNLYKRSNELLAILKTNFTQNIRQLYKKIRFLQPFTRVRCAEMISEPYKRIYNLIQNRFKFYLLKITHFKTAHRNILTHNKFLVSLSNMFSTDTFKVILYVAFKIGSLGALNYQQNIEKQPQKVLYGTIIVLESIPAILRHLHSLGKHLSFLFYSLDVSNIKNNQKNARFVYLVAYYFKNLFRRIFFKITNLSACQPLKKNIRIIKKFFHRSSTFLSVDFSFMNSKLHRYLNLCKLENFCCCVLHLQNRVKFSILIQNFGNMAIRFLLFAKYFKQQFKTTYKNEFEQMQSKEIKESKEKDEPMRLEDVYHCKEIRSTPTIGSTAAVFASILLSSRYNFQNHTNILFTYCLLFLFVFPVILEKFRLHRNPLFVAILSTITFIFANIINNILLFSYCFFLVLYYFGGTFAVIVLNDPSFLYKEVLYNCN